jgi:uncharacterized membrane protein
MNDIEPSENPEFYRWGVFYYNPNDDRVLVPKRLKTMGWTLNFARPTVYYFILMVAIVIWMTTVRNT